MLAVAKKNNVSRGRIIALLDSSTWNNTCMFQGLIMFFINPSVSVKDLKHYAEDAGKSKSEIEKIISPEIKISFLAEGVIIKN